ncbi:hypothetical protein [Geomobilimonas luticola]|uniref:Uncharacterized protein n=1 Tax=Geomobilimonas luticola TaxID=1114878 RepID=A0ABS5SDS4_9BACT|nr:hypothetical protein [Geomobilimonas luticola]MBT0653523.1 hypothetical protein [Geomobilimonas luticola]
MNDSPQPAGPSRRSFIYAGIVVGVIVSIWYVLFKNRAVVVPDPVWTQFVNVSLIMFAAIFQFSLLHKLVTWVARLMKGKKGD